MTPQTLTIPEQNCQANSENNSPTAVTLPAGVTAVKVDLTSSKWSAPNLAGAQVLWGIAYSTDGGLTWGPVRSTNVEIGGPSNNVPAWTYQVDIVGRFGRGGALGQFDFSGSRMPPAGTLVRMLAWPTVNIPLGASITVQ